MCATKSKMLDGAMVDQKIFVYNAARDNNLAALKVSIIRFSFSMSPDFNLIAFVNDFRNLNRLLLLLNVLSFISHLIGFFFIFVFDTLCAGLRKKITTIAKSRQN